MTKESIYIENTDFLKFSIFQKLFFDEKTISRDGIWIAGRPQSRLDPPGTRKPFENHEKPENSKIQSLLGASISSFLRQVSGSPKKTIEDR